jgi:serine/threonine protein phosphatase PrpC
MKCPTCGRENRDKAGFCAWCGQGLSTPASEASGSDATTIEGATSVPTTPSLAVPAPPPAPAQPAEQTAISEPPAAGEKGEATQEPPEAEPPNSAVASPPTTDTGEQLPGNALPAGVPGTPFRPGDILAKHYEITELVESTPERNVYRARDLGRCATCGYDDNVPDDEYCRNCGASLEKPAYVRITEEVRRKPEQYDLQFSEGERDYYVNAEPKPEPEPPTVATPGKTPPPRLIWGRATDKGLQRDLNEDTLEVWVYAKGSGGIVGLFVVADGLGGQDSGEVASRMTTDTIWESVRESVWQPILRGDTFNAKDLGKHVREAVVAANQVVYEARLGRKSEMSSTVTLALIIDGQAVIGNVGDSRTYLWNASGLRRITKDHSLVQRLVDTGQIAPDEVYSHPQRNLIYQSIGDRPQVQVDIFDHILAVDDQLILCSDGLWEMVHDEGLEEMLLAESDPQRACDRLVQNANLAGGDDNISVIIVRAVSA